MGADTKATKPTGPATEVATAARATAKSMSSSRERSTPHAEGARGVVAQLQAAERAAGPEGERHDDDHQHRQRAQRPSRRPR